MIGDHYRDKWTPWVEPNTIPNTYTYTNITTSPTTQEQLDALKKEVLEMKELLKKAIKYDELNNQKNCEMEEKMEVIRKVAKMVGVDLEDILPK